MDPTTAAIGFGAAALGAAVYAKCGSRPAPTDVKVQAERSRPSELSDYNSVKIFKTTDGKASLPIRMGKEGFAAMKPQTLHDLFQEIFGKSKGDLPALKCEDPKSYKIPTKADVKSGKFDPNADASAPTDDWKTWTYRQYYDESREVAQGFIKLGLERHASVNIWGFNSPEWFMSEVGTIFAGGKAAGIYPTDTPDQVKFKIKHSGGQIVCIEKKKHLDALHSIKDEITNVKAIVAWGFEPTQEDKDSFKCQVLSWNEVRAYGRGQEDALEKRLNDQKPGHCCALIYTSGTTGEPKAVMISHDNIIFESQVVMDTLPVAKNQEQERLISYLPLSHVAGMLLDIISPLLGTAKYPGHITIFFARPYDLNFGTVGNRLRAVTPTVFLGVPRVWEKIEDKIKKIGAKTKGLVKKIAVWAKSKGLTHARNLQLGGSGVYPWGYNLANKLVLKKIKSKLGLQHCKFAFTGAAPIKVSTLEFFGALGININEVYGMSECTGATTWSLDECHQWGSCGYAMKGTEVKIFRVHVNDQGKYTFTNIEQKKTPTLATRDNQDPSQGPVTNEYEGEICYRGRHIMMGYLANPDLGEGHISTITAKLNDAIDNEGWLHSGDKGLMTMNGMVKITGRYKELLIGAGGENVAPVPIEDACKDACPEISNIVMFGNKKPFLGAFVSLKVTGNPGETPGTNILAQPIPGSNAKTIEEARADPAVHAYLASKINEGCDKAAPSNAARIKKFTILPYDLSVQGKELTSTLKTKRAVVVKNFQKGFDATYASKDRNMYVPCDY